MSESKLYADPDVLYEKYVYETKSVGEIADEFNVTANAIQYWLRAHSLPCGASRNVRYLLSHPPATVSELPNTHVPPNDRKNGVNRICVEGTAPGAGEPRGRQTPVFYLHGIHDMVDVALKYLYENPILANMGQQPVVRVLSDHGPMDKDSARESYYIYHDTQ